MLFQLFSLYVLVKSTSEVMTLWRYTNLFIIIIIIKLQIWIFKIISYKNLHRA